jgi:cytochrome c-type biogenesis protein CcmE
MKARHKRAAFVALGLCGLATAAALALSAFNQNLVFFFTPSQVAANQAPAGRIFRIGGLVEEGSLRRGSDGVSWYFTITDSVNSTQVAHKGVLPDLFKEGRGCVAQGRIGADGIFQADQVLARHDENYMPAEAAYAVGKAKQPSVEAGGTFLNK